MDTLRLICLWTVLVMVPGTVLPQATGGHAPGQALPRPAAKAALDAGPLSGEVNLFTGGLSLDYGFGEVSTLSGLGYPLALGHQSNMQLSFDPPHTSGVPYGEGWALAGACVTVETYAFDHLPADLPHDLVHGRKYTPAQVAERGRLYFANPTLQLPGGGGGRLVYKYPAPDDPSVAIYHLQGFDEYVEVRFDGQVWMARRPDGTRYTYSLAQYGLRNPTQATAWLAMDGSTPVMPRAEALRWHLTGIDNPNHANGQRIALDYHTLGKEDPYGELSQAAVRQQLNTEGVLLGFQVWTQAALTQAAAQGYHPRHPNGDMVQAGDTTLFRGSPLQRPAAFRDILLRSVTALDAQGGEMSRAELVYRSWRPETELAGDPSKLARGRFLLLSDPQTVRLDSLTTQKTVWFRGTDETVSQNWHGPRPAIINPQAFETAWRRYMHPRANQHPLASLRKPHHGSNPYLIQMTGLPNIPNAWYFASSSALPSPSGSIPFTHSVLESPRIDLATLPPGDDYELRTLIRLPQAIANHDMNFDVRVATGLRDDHPWYVQSGGQFPYYSYQGQRLRLAPQLSGPQGYWENGYTLFSTLPNIAKWNPAYAL